MTDDQKKIRPAVERMLQEAKKLAEEARKNPNKQDKTKEIFADVLGEVWKQFPEDDEPLTPEELEQLERAREDKEWTSLEDLKRELDIKGDTKE